jgi:hypothetical protein
VPRILAGHTNRSGQGCVVRFRPAELASYLQTKDMAVRTGTNEVTFALTQTKPQWPNLVLWSSLLNGYE